MVAWSSEAPRARPMDLLGAAAARAPEGVVLRAEFSVAPDSAIFGGHYPHFPLLPGVYFVEAALQLLEAHGLAGTAPERRVLRVADLRLSAAALPGMEISVVLTPAAAPAGEQAWSCRCSHGARALASLTLALGRRSAMSAPPQPSPLLAPVRLGAREIVNRLAHRPPILLVDRARVSADGRALQADKLVSLNELCYAELGQAGTDAQLAYPGTLLIESFVQACALLVTQLRPVAREHEVMILGGVREVRFHGDAGPGVRVRHELALQRLIADTALVSGCSRIGPRVIAQFKEVLVAVRPASGLRPPPV